MIKNYFFIFNKWNTIAPSLAHNFPKIWQKNIKLLNKSALSNRNTALVMIFYCWWYLNNSHFGTFCFSCLATKQQWIKKTRQISKVLPKKKNRHKLGQKTRMGIHKDYEEEEVGGAKGWWRHDVTRGWRRKLKPLKLKVRSLPSWSSIMKL